MVYMTSHIKIGKRIFQRVNSVKIRSGRKMLTQTATINLANIKKFLSDPNNRINVGDEVEISLGYNGKTNVEFTGYVAGVKAGIPFEITCEDQMWKLKQQNVNKSWEEVKLIDVLRFLVSDTNISECPDITLSPFRLNNVSKAKALEEIKRNYHLDIYFRDKKLYAGLAYLQSGSKRVLYHFQKNIPSMRLQSGLTFKKAEDIKVKVQVISMLPNNTVIKADLGDMGGEVHTYTVFNFTKEEINQQATAIISKMKYDGFRGRLLTFGEPFIQHGDVAVLKSNNLLDVQGSYFVDSVETTYGFPAGFKREVELGSVAKGGKS